MYTGAERVAAALHKTIGSQGLPTGPLLRCPLLPAPHSVKRLSTRSLSRRVRS
jgi:hypothetical protein